MISDLDREKIRGVNPLTEDWYRCNNCDRVVVISQANFIQEVTERSKNCGECVVFLEKERIKEIKRRAKALRESKRADL